MHTNFTKRGFRLTFRLPLSFLSEFSPNGRFLSNKSRNFLYEIQETADELTQKRLDHDPEKDDPFERPKRRRNSWIQKGTQSFHEISPFSDPSNPQSVWNSDHTFPNPKAPLSFIDFRKIHNLEDVFKAMISSRFYLQMRQIVAGLSRCRSLGRRITRERLDQIIRLAHSTIGSTRKKDAVGMFLMCAVYTVRHPEFLNELAQRTIDKGFIKDMTIRELGTMVHSTTTLLKLRQTTLPAMDSAAAIRKEDSENSQERSLAFDLHSVLNLLKCVMEEMELRKMDDELELRLPSVLSKLQDFPVEDVGLDPLIEKLVSRVIETRVSVEALSTMIAFLAKQKKMDSTNLMKYLSEFAKPERLASARASLLIDALCAVPCEGKYSEIRAAILEELDQPTRQFELTDSQTRTLQRLRLESERVNDNHPE